MTQHPFTALVPVTATGTNQADAREYARALIDDHLARLDDELPLGNLSTGPVTLIDPVNLRAALTGIRNTVAVARNGEIGQATALGSIDRAAETLLAAITTAPACNVCGDPGKPVNDGTGQSYALCDSDDQTHACVRESLPTRSTSSGGSAV